MELDVFRGAEERGVCVGDGWLAHWEVPGRDNCEYVSGIKRSSIEHLDLMVQNVVLWWFCSLVSLHPRCKLVTNVPAPRVRR